jgi:hypothetical protein
MACTRRLCSLLQMLGSQCFGYVSRVLHDHASSLSLAHANEHTVGLIEQCEILHGPQELTRRAYS